MTKAHRTPLLILILALTLSFATAQPAGAVELYTYTVSGFAGLGGSQDAEPGDGFDNTGLQAGFSVITEPHTRAAVRLGTLGLGGGDEFGLLSDARLDYLTLAGEYRFPENFYDSWVYLGLGAYSLDGDPRFPGVDGSDTALGGVLGITGEFPISRSFDFVVELSGHWVNFDDAQVFAMGHAGVAYHF